MRRNKLTSLAMLAVALTVMACNGNTVYHQYEHTPVEGWERTDTLYYTIENIKATADYQEEIGLRINGSYPFTSLFLVVEQHIRSQNQSLTSLNGTQRKDTISCRFVDQEGNIKGRGVNYYQYNFMLTTLHLNVGDTLDIRIHHNMRRETLPGISDIGIRLERQ